MVWLWPSVREKGSCCKKGVKSVSARRKAVWFPPPGTDLSHAQAQQEKFLKDQPPPGQLQRMAVGGKVDVFVGVPHPAEAVFLQHPLRQHVLQMIPPFLQGLAHIGADHLVGQPLGERVHRADGAFPVWVQHLGGVHLPAEQPPGDLAVKTVGMLQFQGLVGIDVVEDGDGELAFPIGDIHLKQAQSLADALFSLFAEHRPLNAHRLPRLGLQNGHGIGKIHPGPGIVTQKEQRSSTPNFS